jgi:glycosyltransferase involved in cell wall biosynthesis
MWSAPRVSVGIPVYNGENYLAEALDAFLAQTYTDFELIVSDNASSDRTENICRDYAARDRRIRYSRNDRNLGAAPNYNRTFELAAGEFFKWAAHDDLVAPTFLEKCVAALDADPDAVLCQGLVDFIDANGESLGVYNSGLTGVASPSPSVRFAAAVLLPHACTEFAGLIRRQALVGTLLTGNFHSADRALIAELALRGRLIQLQEPLFMLRDHAARYTRAALRPKERLAWQDTQWVARRHFPTWRLYAEYWRMVPRHLQGRQERLRCYAYLLKWWWVNWNWARMAVDVLAAFQPDIVEWAQAFKQRLFDPEPGPGRHHPNRVNSRP